MLFIIAILIAHWVGDFVLQSHQMSVTKSSNNYILLVHSVVYTIPIVITCIIVGIPYSIFIYLLIAISHFIVDWCTSRVTKNLWERKSIHNFFVVIGADQAIHLIILTILLK